MWLITNLSTGQFYHLLQEKGKYVVGRAGSDIILKDDSSISRTHALLLLQDGPRNILSLIDSGSKYGTYLNDGIGTNTKLNTGEAMVLHDGSRIRFGLLKNEWKLNSIAFVSMSSSLATDKSVEILKCLANLGGRFINKWEPGCTHLTMNEISVTVKVLYALLNNVPIVKCEYWHDLLQAARKVQTALPSPSLYLPKISELLKNKSHLDFGFRPDRKKLFSGKTFVFMNKKHSDMYGPIVEMAGGAFRNLNIGIQKAFLIKANVVVVQYVPATQSQSSETINTIADFLEANSRRIIPEYEIGLAIVNCSVEKYCNPSYKILSDLMPSTMALVIDREDSVLVENTGLAKIYSNSETDSEVPETDLTSQINSDVNTFEASCLLTADSVNLLETREKVSVPPKAELNDDMPNIMVTESNTDESQLKRKRNLNVILSDSDSSDELVFQHKKKPNLCKELNEDTQQESYSEHETSKGNISKHNSKPVTAPKPVPKPLPIVTNDKRNKISTAGFLNKTQTQATQKENEASTSVFAEKQSMVASKRGRIALITDDDSDDENDLFNFGSSAQTLSSAKKSRMCDENSENVGDSDEELFNFAKPSESNVLSNESEDLEPTQEYIPKNNSKCASTISVRPKFIPKKTSITGWLCSSLNKMNMMKEESFDCMLEPENVKAKNESNTVAIEQTESKSSDESLDRKVLVSGFKVRFCSLTKRLQNKDSNKNILCETVNSSAPNFKVFVKKCNYKPQEKVIKCGRSFR